MTLFFDKNVKRKSHKVSINPEKELITIDGTPLLREYNSLFAQNNGFDSIEEFWNQFEQPFDGVIWTDFNYDEFLLDYKAYFGSEIYSPSFLR